jgi:hypothetical protein
MYSISFCYDFTLKGMVANNRFREWSSGVIKDPAVSSTLGIGSRGFNDTANPLPTSRWDYGIFYKNVQVGSHSLIDTMGSDPDPVVS